MRVQLNSFWHDCEGQDVIEYALLIAFITVISAAIYIYTPEHTARLWGKTEGHLQNARRVTGAE